MTNPIAAWLAANAAEPRYGSERYAIRPVTGAGYYALLDGDQELSDTDACARLNAQEKTIDELRAALDDAHQHVGALIASGDAAHDALNELIGAEYDVTGEQKQLGFALTAARTWLRRRG